MGHRSRTSPLLTIVLAGALLGAPAAAEPGRVAAASLPPNDAFSGALDLTLGPSLAGQDNTLATVQPGEPPSWETVERTVWYRFVAPATTTVMVTVTHGTIAWPIAVAYAGTTLGSLEELAFDTKREPTDPSLKVWLAVTAGETYYLQVGSAWQSAPGTFSIGIGVDTLQPIVNTVEVGFATAGMSRISTGYQPRLRLKWTATAVGSPVAKYLVEASIDGGPWQYAGYTATLSGQACPIGHRCRFRVQAIDELGRRSAWVLSSSVRLSAHQDTSAFVRYRGTWSSMTSAFAFGGTLRKSRTGGSSASLTFSGRAVGIVSGKSETRGAMRVYIDGAFQRRVDLSTLPYGAASVVWTKAWPTKATRTVKVVVVGGTGRVDLDAFLILK